MMPWRPARCLTVLRDEINAYAPNRDRSSDGIIGDQAHSTRKSDHNPDANGVVHAIDIDRDGIPAEQIVQHLVELGRAGDPRLRGGYVIFTGRIWSHARGWVERAYTGTNAHAKHFHLSVTYDDACDSTGEWGIRAALLPPPPLPQPRKRLDMPLLFSDKTNTDPAQVFETGSELFVLDDGADSAALQAAEVPIVAVSKGLFDRIKNEAK